MVWNVKRSEDQNVLKLAQNFIHKTGPFDGSGFETAAIPPPRDRKASFPRPLLFDFPYLQILFHIVRKVSNFKHIISNIIIYVSVI